MTIRLCISGSRGFSSMHLVRDFVAALPSYVTVVHGGARGVDTVADAAARARGLAVDVFQADWDGLGRRAGPVRNAAMLCTCDRLVAFWDGTSPGTRHAVSAALTLGIPTVVVGPAGEVSGLPPPAR